MSYLSKSFFVFSTLFVQSLLPAANAQGLDIPQNGLVTDETIGYEPLCGTLGDNTYTEFEWDVGARCITAMSVFKDAPETVVIYDRSGVKLEGNVIGGLNAVPVCVCFSLAERTETYNADICIFHNEQGKLESDFVGFSAPPGSPPSGSYYVLSTLSPNSTKALPQCRNVDLPARSAEWTATAAGIRSSVAPAEPGSQTSISSGEGSGTQTSLSPSSSSASADDDDDPSSGFRLGMSLTLAFTTFLVAISL
ncbi:hypothetical protein CC1G_07483 [Coprinopsis cinerea okayama7|uniref:Uncharacterized protein n=1 Tax=Coprinopsis cinerea (strain Okayama-7 / 130 / ATCC MYA-4618 / FGSC 9003) TaxID=240176 RepID=A8NBB3_COPC7|nr:hypothetical protein CC1G_07483 [Coprinopsis cinerea okayama7\|eukprot:XP_001832112.1 hypothetical protein CC1G_07483 [Coprinopsis cinerea okayama7\